MKPTASSPRPAYEHIPRLTDLIGHEGIPGVHYAIVAVENLIRAQDESWEDITGGTRAFPIRGPKGEVGCKLLGRGKPIPGQMHGASRSRLYIDRTVYERTGHGPAKPTTQPSQPTSTPSKPLAGAPTSA